MSLVKCQIFQASSNLHVKCKAVNFEMERAEGISLIWYLISKWIFSPQIWWFGFAQVKKTPIIKAKPLKLDYNSRLKKKYGRWYQPNLKHNPLMLHLMLYDSLTYDAQILN